MRHSAKIVLPIDRREKADGQTTLAGHDLTQARKRCAVECLPGPTFGGDIECQAGAKRISNDMDHSGIMPQKIRQRIMNKACSEPRLGFPLRTRNRLSTTMGNCDHRGSSRSPNNRFDREREAHHVELRENLGQTDPNSDRMWRLTHSSSGRSEKSDLTKPTGRGSHEP